MVASACSVRVSESVTRALTVYRWPSQSRRVTTGDGAPYPEADSTAPHVVGGTERQCAERTRDQCGGVGDSGA